MDGRDEFLDRIQEMVASQVTELEFDYELCQFANQLLGTLTDAFEKAGSELEEVGYYSEAIISREVADEFRAMTITEKTP